MPTSPPKTRVALVVNNFDVGGLEKVVLSLLGHLDRTRFEPFVVCLDGEGKLFSEVKVPEDHRLILRKDARLKLPLVQVDTALLGTLRTFFQERAIDVVHTHNLAPLIYAGLAARTIPRGRPRVAYTEHNQIYRANRLQRLKFLAYLRLADEVCTCSKDLEQFFREKLRIRRPIRVLYNGIDGGRYARVDGGPVRRELGLTDEHLVVGTAVVLSEQKGIRYLVEAAKDVCAKEPRARFVVAGDGPLRKDHQDQVKAAGLEDRFKFLGYRGDIPQVVSSFDVHVLPSLWEGLPLSLLEALAIGKPVVATKVGGNPEVVVDGENGRIVPPKDPAALAQALLQILGDPAFRRDVAARNVARFKSTFSLEAMMASHGALYEAMATGR